MTFRGHDESEDIENEETFLSSWSFLLTTMITSRGLLLQNAT